MTDRIKALNIDKQAEFFMPPRVVDELLSFFDDKEQPFLQDFLAVVIIKSPDQHALNVSATIFYQYVDETRQRAYRGLNAAEEEIQKAARLMMGKEELGKKEFEMTVGPVVKAFRDRYRQATRYGFIDSVADLDLIMLAKETGGYLVTTDEGVIRWGRIFGIKELPAHVFGSVLRGAEEKT